MDRYSTSSTKAPLSVHMAPAQARNSTICVGEDMGPILLVILGYSMLWSWIEHLVGIATRHAADSGRRFRRQCFENVQ